MACELETEAERLYNATGIGTMAAAREVAEILVARDRAWARLLKASREVARDRKWQGREDASAGWLNRMLATEGAAQAECAAARKALRDLGVNVDALTAE